MNEIYKTAAIISNTGVVTDLIAVPLNDAGDTDFQIEGNTVVIVGGALIASIGDTYVNDDFVSPDGPYATEPTP